MSEHTDMQGEAEHILACQGVHLSNSVIFCHCPSSFGSQEQWAVTTVSKGLFQVLIHGLARDMTWESHLFCSKNLLTDSKQVFIFDKRMGGVESPE